MKIRLTYWGDYKNLGDLLSPYIVGKLSGEKIFHLNRGVDLSLYRLFRSLLSVVKKGSFAKFVYALECRHKNILAIGSIMSLANRKSIVWGSGFIAPNRKCKACKIYAVRGKLTANRLKELGYDVSDIAYGDPALLLPLFVSPSKQKSRLVGIIPHWRETDKFKTQYGIAAHIIDIRTDNVEAFVNDLTGCQYILSSSLHGIIIAHAYGIPALLIEKKDEKEFGYFKYEDYFSSVGIEPYHWIDFNESLLADEYELQLLFEKHADKALPQTELRIIQKALLETAPFPLKKEYKNLFG